MARKKTGRFRARFGKPKTAEENRKKMKALLREWDE